MMNQTCNGHPNKEELFQHAFFPPAFLSSMVEVDDAI